jgi:DNA-binding transcriptional MocR family regulator
VAAYDTLQADEFLERKRGSGSFVSVHGRERSLDQRAFVIARRAATGGFPTARARDPIDLSSAAPVDAGIVDQGAIEVGLRAARTVQPGDGYLALGLPSLREAIASHMTSWGALTNADEVLVTSGGQEGMFLTSKLVAGPGDVVAIEDPGWIGMIDALQSSGAALRGVPVDQDGLRVDILARILAEDEVTAVVVSPSVNNPTGYIMSEDRRRKLLDLARRHRFVIVEDLSLADLVPDRGLPRPIGGRDSDSLVLSIGSLSKLAWGGLRIGWVRASPDLIARLGHWKLIVNSGTSIVSQGIATHLLGDAKRIRRQSHQAMSVRLEALSSELRRMLPDWEWEPPPGGLSVWVRLPFGTALGLSQVALRHDVIITPGDLASLTGSAADRFRLPFVLAPDQLREGVRRLAIAWDEYRCSRGLSMQADSMTAPRMEAGRRSSVDTVSSRDG